LTFIAAAASEPGSTPLGLEEAHRELKISPAEFDEVAAELRRTLDFFKVPEQEKEEALGAFAAHKGELTGRILPVASSVPQTGAVRESAASRPC
jgi:hypothetical protein